MCTLSLAVLLPSGDGSGVQGPDAPEAPASSRSWELGTGEARYILADWLPPRLEGFGGWFPCAPVEELGAPRVATPSFTIFESKAPR